MFLCFLYLLLFGIHFVFLFHLPFLVCALHFLLTSSLVPFLKYILHFYKFLSPLFHSSRLFLPSTITFHSAYSLLFLSFVFNVEYVIFYFPLFHHYHYFQGFISFVFLFSLSSSFFISCVFFILFSFPFCFSVFSSSISSFCFSSSLYS
jgi:hypothetical protein